MKLRHLFIIFFSTLAFLAQADNVTLKQAEAYANRFFHQHPGISSTDTHLQLAWDGAENSSRNSDSQPAFYVFNRGKDKGFVIISGSTSTNPILAYSNEGSFSAANMPSNIKAWMHSLRSSIRYKEQHQASRSVAQSPAWSQVMQPSKEVDLDTPNWDQDNPYNLKCPLYYDVHCYTGCAITATAIVMGYHQWPDKGIGTLPGYTTSALGIRIAPVTLGETYRWAQMPYINGNYLDWNNPEQDDAISTLMYHVGVMARADYTTYGTGASLSTIYQGLISNMKYNPRMAYITRDGYGDEEWSQMLRDEIDAKRPVIYEGFDEQTGHAFVIDGYNSNGYFNVNWGWGGRYNGFYLINDMAPGMGGTGANGSGTYNLLQAGIFGVMPRTDTPQEASLEFIYNKMFTPGLHIENLELPAQKGDTFIPNVGLVRNIGITTLNGTCQLVMTDHKGNIIERFQSSPVNDLSPASTQFPLEYKRTETITQEVKPGYRLRVVFQPSGSDEWSPILCDPSFGPWEVILMEEADQPLEEATTLSYNSLSGIATIITLDGVTAQLKEHSSGADCSSVLTVSGSTITIASRQLQKGLYVLTLKKGTDQIELHLRF